MDILEKAKGEGSRGGKIIGHTKSGKPIYDTYNHPKHKDFTAQDHLDASDKHMEVMSDPKTRIHSTDKHDEESASHYRKYESIKKEGERNFNHKVGDTVNLPSKGGKFEIRKIDNNGVTLAKVGEKNASLSVSHKKFNEYLENKEVQKALTTLEIGYLNGEVSKEVIEKARMQVDTLSKAEDWNVKE